MEKDRVGVRNLLFCGIYGVVNAILAIPCMYGYAQVIFAMDVYKPFMPALSKLVLVSSVVHQLCFTLKSSMPFAIGQVQDAGLIFLAHMTTNVANAAMRDDVQVDPRSIVATSIVCTALATALLGLAVLVFGKLRWARFVSYLPMPVIGGYLAFIGFFCVEAGLGLCINSAVNGFRTWYKLADLHALVLCLPGVGFGVAYMVVCRRVNHPGALPAAIAATPLFFYAALYLTGSTFEDARDFGWIGPDVEAAAPAEVFRLFELGRVEWSALPGELPVWLGMVFVVSFSSCLDVAAIEIDMGKPLDTNAELRMVGWSNIFSGLTGGFTGSYIFSQTIFTYRTRTNSRIVGVVVMAAEVAVFFAMVDPLQYVPLFFFAATLTFTGFELLFEWLIEVRSKLTSTEYGVLLVTFMAIQVLGINGGMATGVVAAMMQFISSHSASTEPTLVERRSRVVRSGRDMQRLKELLESQHILTLQLSGTIFFGSSVKLLEDITRVLDRRPPGDDHHYPTRRLSNRSSGVHFLAAADAEPQPRSSPAPAAGRPSEATPLLSGAKGASAGDYGGAAEDAEAPSPAAASMGRMLILDMEGVTNVDASAARSCFNMLRSACLRRRVGLVYARLNRRAAMQLRVHGCLDGLRGHEARESRGEWVGVRCYGTIEGALDFCESTLLGSAAGALEEESGGGGIGAEGEMTVGQVVQTIVSYGGVPQDGSPDALSVMHGAEFASADLACLDRVAIRRDVARGETIFAAGETAHSFFVLLDGSVELQASDRSQAPKFLKTQLFRGALFGFVDYQLAMARRFDCVATADARLAAFGSHEVKKLVEKHPRAAWALEKATLYACALELSNARDL